MGEIIETNHVCIIDNTEETIQSIKYLTDKILCNTYIDTHRSAVNIDPETLKDCSLIIIEESLPGISGSKFIGKVYDSFYINEMHLFPNIIFLTHMDEEFMKERLIVEDLYTKIPSFRILQKPISPVDFKHAIHGVCPRIRKNIREDISVPKILNGTESLSFALKSVIGMRQQPIMEQI